MANRAEHRRSDPRVTGMSDDRRPVTEAPANPPSVPAALEKLASATQRVITKRIDLLMLENHELVASLLFKAAFAGFGVVLGLAAWFAAISSLVLYVMPGWSRLYQLILFAGINAAAGAIVVGLALRKQLPLLAGEPSEEGRPREGGD